MTSPSALRRLDREGGPLTIGIDLPLDNDLTPHGGAANRTNGVPDLTGHAEKAALADRLGFAALWVRDVPLYDPVRFGDAGTVFETFTHLGHLAATTRDVVLGTAAVVLPLRAPLLTAKAAATVDALSGGRFVLGVASGDRPVEYPMFGLDFDRRGAAFRDAVLTLRSAWATPPAGQGVAVPSLDLSEQLQLDVLPKPAGGTVPIVVAGRAQQTVEWVADHADGWFNYPRDLAGLAAQMGQWRRLTLERGRRLPYLMPMMLDLSEDPRTRATPIFHGIRAGRHELLDHLHRLDELGVSHLSLSLRCSTRPVEEVLHELAETVLPDFPSQPAAPALGHATAG
ncbi:TIGR03571 family LLM class oxidoreductase [Streptomyces polygonati]|uniref:TIGR03571 family LLM class oxidoreductase n=1 Tax=Streptomyces polygonati TaxID=1617087 RepID=A0ABV8HNJ6_9ACTN